jgi:microcompartment protein CcmL/EutN
LQKSEAIGLLEFGSVARGLQSTDAMLKAAEVQLLLAMPVCAGKFATLVAGTVASVTSAVAAGETAAEGQVLDRLVLPNVHPQLFPALTGTAQVERVEAIGVVETFGIAASVLAADAAAKAASVTLLEVRLARGLGGKAYFTLTGTVSAVEAAVAAACLLVQESGLLVHRTVIPSPHPDLIGFVI